MKKLVYLLAAVLVTSIFLPVQSVFAQKSLPQVPITYSGDTDKSIIRRAQWIEGAKKEGNLMWWGSRAPKEMFAMIAEFNKIYPFVKVDFWGTNNTEIATKMEAEHIAGRCSVDILQGGDPENLPRWREKGWITKFTEIIPGIEKKPKSSYSKFGDAAQAGQTTYTPQYNTKLVSATEAPRSWEDLLNPRWKGQLVLGTTPRAWVTLALADGGWGIGKTEEFLAKLRRQEPIWVSGPTAGLTLVIAGESKILADGLFHSYVLAIQKGAPIEWCRVHPIVVAGAYISLPTKAPNPNSARLFMEWLLSPQGSIQYERITNQGSPLPGSGTKTSKLLEGFNFCIRDEEVILKSAALNLEERFKEILGIQQK